VSVVILLIQTLSYNDMVLTACVATWAELSVVCFASTFSMQGTEPATFLSKKYIILTSQYKKANWFSSLLLINEPVLEEQINDPVSSIFMVKEDKETPMHQPYPILELV
jgi:hypothetical protein